MVHRVSMLTGIVLATLIASSTTAEDEFDIKPPASAFPVKKLWATRYYMHYLRPVEERGASLLLHKEGSPFGISISNRDFCFGALQGTKGIRAGGQVEVYNVDGVVPRSLAKCAFGGGTTAQTNEKLGRQAWVRLTGDGVYGLGARGWRLIPYRTVAVDPKTIPLGTVLFIERLKGVQFDDGGVRRVHDGYVIAGDVGKSISGNHIDFFTGDFTGPAPPFVTSRSDGLFDARVVSDASATEKLRAELRYAP